jgi:two-component system phosphate regulon response regulator PhoB
MKPKVLVIDDEQDLVRLVRYNLEREGYEVCVAFNGQDALALAWSKSPDVVVLDLMLPDRSGFDLCGELKSQCRQQSGKALKVLMLTARAAEADRIMGFERGADDYLTKPFSPRELALRIRALLGRNEADPRNAPILEVGPITIHQEQVRVLIAGEEVQLTQLEYKILRTLALRPNVVRSREQLLADVWENTATEVLDRTVDAHVKRLRSKLGVARHQLETVRGLGYRLKEGLASAPAETTPPPKKTLASVH